MQNGQYLKKLVQKWDSEVFTEPKAGGEYHYSMMVSQENSSGQLTGQLTIISKTPFLPYHRHLAIPLKRALCLIASHNVQEDYGSIVQNLFFGFLAGKPVDTASRNTFYQLQGWNPEQYFMIVLLRREHGSTVTYNYDLKNMQKLFPNVLYCDGSMLPEHACEDIICCVPLKILEKQRKTGLRLTESPEVFLQTAAKQKLQYHASYPFIGIEHLAEQYQQALRCQQSNYRNYYQCGLEDLASLKNSRTYRQLAIHPALYRICEYDRQKLTGFYDILKTYLRCERNRGKTADMLYVHKNTLLYRLEKLESLFELNLEDAYEREYLLLSIRVLESIKTEPDSDLFP
jgi:hypothetical protein